MKFLSLAIMALVGAAYANKEQFERYDQTDDLDELGEIVNDDDLQQEEYEPAVLPVLHASDTRIDKAFNNWRWNTTPNISLTAYVKSHNEWLDRTKDLLKVVPAKYNKSLDALLNSTETLGTNAIILVTMSPTGWEFLAPVPAVNRTEWNERSHKSIVDFIDQVTDAKQKAGAIQFLHAFEKVNVARDEVFKGIQVIYHLNLSDESEIKQKEFQGKVALMMIANAAQDTAAELYQKYVTGPWPYPDWPAYLYGIIGAVVYTWLLYMIDKKLYPEEEEKSAVVVNEKVDDVEKDLKTVFMQ